MKKGDEILVIGAFNRELLKARVTRVRGSEMWWRESYWSDGSRSGSESRKLYISDRGITWSPAWREKEAAAFRVTVAL